jgi:hypothetical protein
MEKINKAIMTIPANSATEKQLHSPGISGEEIKYMFCAPEDDFAWHNGVGQVRMTVSRFDFDQDMFTIWDVLEANAKTIHER